MEEVLVEVRDLLHEIRSAETFPEPWISLRRACELKGISYGSVSQSKYRWRQPAGGAPDGFINNRKYWRPITIKQWIMQTDEDLWALYGKDSEQEEE